MGGHNSGGGGSVYWRIDLDHVPKVTTRPQDDGRGWTEGGHDPDPAKIDDQWFTVSIQVPAEFTGASARENYLKALRDPQSPWGIREHPKDPNRVYLNVKIEHQDEDRPSQIRTSWGRSPNVIPPRGKDRPR